MIMTCFNFMYNLWLSTFVQSMISIISALMATGTERGDAGGFASIQGSRG